MSATLPIEAELNFEDGWIGCPHWRRFRWEQPAEMAPVALLHSADLPGLSLPVLNPRLVAPDYAPWLTVADRAALELSDDGELEWLTVLNIQAEPLVVTANLLGPLAVNRRTGAARQVILADSGYSASHPVGAPHAAEAPGAEVDHAGPDATA
jgi:flagellar assembly factor FliW